jgi:hypothetical protein
MSSVLERWRACTIFTSCTDLQPAWGWERKDKSYFNTMQHVQKVLSYWSCSLYYPFPLFFLEYWNSFPVFWLIEKHYVRTMFLQFVGLVSRRCASCCVSMYKQNCCRPWKCGRFISSLHILEVLTFTIFSLDEIEISTRYL